MTSEYEKKIADAVKAKVESGEYADNELTRALLTIIIFIALLVIMFGLTTDTGKAILAIIALLSFVALAYGIALEVAKMLVGE